MFFLLPVAVLHEMELGQPKPHLTACSEVFLLRVSAKPPYKVTHQ